MINKNVITKATKKIEKKLKKGNKNNDSLKKNLINKLLIKDLKLRQLS